MIKYILCTKLAVVAAALFFLTPATHQAEAKIKLPPKCKLPYIKVHWGTSVKKSWAQRRARRKWQRRARQIHGWKYRKWSNAHKRNSSDCKKHRRRWRCAAGAYACRG